MMTNAEGNIPIVTSEKIPKILEVLSAFRDFNFVQLRNRVLELADGKTEEICGFFYADGSVHQVPNSHANPAFHWRIAKTDELAAPPNPVGVFHSHWHDEAGDRLSVDDVIASQKAGLPFFVVHTGTKAYDYYDPRYIHPYPLLERSDVPVTSLDYYKDWQWEWARCDCTTVVTSFFRGYLDMAEVSYQKRSPDMEEFLRPGWNRLAEYLESLGFVSVPTTEAVRLHDVVLMSFKGQNAHHCAVIVDADKPKMLHALQRGSVTKVEMYSQFFRDHTRAIYRRGA